MAKTFHVVPRGVALVIGCNTFPTWNSYPGPVRLAGHRQPGDRQAAPARGAAAGDHRAVRPGGARRGRLRPEPGACWPPRSPARGWPRRWPLRPEVRIVDFTGSTEYGDWLEANARQAVGLHREGRRQHRRRRLHRRLRRDVPQPRLLADPLQRADVHHPAEHPGPADGIATDEGHKSFDEVAAGIAAAVGKLHRGPGAGGRVDRRDRQRRACWSGWTRSRKVGEPVLESRAVAHPALPRRGGPYADDRQARRGRPTPTSTARSGSGRSRSSIATDSTAHSLEMLRGDRRREAAR